MKKCVVTMLAVLLLATGAAGQTRPTRPGNLPEAAATPKETASDAVLASFEFDFPGGTPEQFVRALEKASGQSFNILVSPAAGTVQLPPIRLKVAAAPRLKSSQAKPAPVNNATGGVRARPASDR